jgi:hypothetical protein
MDFLSFSGNEENNVEENIKAIDTEQKLNYRK